MRSMGYKAPLMGALFDAYAIIVVVAMRSD